MSNYIPNYRMFNVQGTEVFNKDLQNKGEWCLHGASIEKTFVQMFGEKLDVIINPEKRNSPYVLDLLNIKHNIFSDLKTQNTPFFKSEKKYGINPQFAVTFNEKDVTRYRNYLEEGLNEIFIYFWIDWVPIRWEMGKQSISVEPMKGVWGIRFTNILKILNESPTHDYLQRKDDKIGNAKQSYILNIQQEKFARLT